MTTGEVRSSGRPDALGAVVGLLAGVLFLRAGFDGFLTRDPALYLYAGQRFADGVPPYDGVLNRSGPLSHALTGFGVWLGRGLGMDDVLAARAFFLVLSVLAVYAVYALGRDALGGRWAGVVAAVTLAGLGGFVHYATAGPREKTAMVLFLALALREILRGRWWTAGLWTSVGTLTWQPMFFPAVAAALAGLLLVERPGRRLRSLLVLTVAGLLPLAAFLVGYAVMGQLQYFLDCFLLIHLTYTQQPGLAGHADYVWRLVVSGYGATRWVLVAGLAASLLAPLVVLARPGWLRDDRGRALAVVGVAAWGAMLWNLRAFNGWPDSFIVLPMAALGVAVLAWSLRRILPDRLRLAVPALWALVAVLLAVQFQAQDRDDRLAVQRDRVETADGIVSAALGRDPVYLSVQAPEVLVLARRPNLVQFQMYSSGLANYVDHTWPGGLAGLSEEIADRRPDVVVMANGNTGTWLLPVLEADYRRCGRGDGISWFLSAEVPKDVCQQVHGVMRDTQPVAE